MRELAYIFLDVTYVTFVEFRQDLTRPSDSLTTPQRRKSTFVLPAKQSVSIWRVPAPNRWLIRYREQKPGELAFELLKIVDSVQMVRHCVLHNIGPCTANELSNRV